MIQFINSIIEKIPAEFLRDAIGFILYFAAGVLITLTAGFVIKCLCLLFENCRPTVRRIRNYFSKEERKKRKEIREFELSFLQKIKREEQIKALGGFTSEQVYEIRRGLERRYNTALAAEVSISRNEIEDYVHNDLLNKYAIRDIAYKIAERMLNEGYITFETEYDPLWRVERIRGTARVLHRK